VTAYENGSTGRPVPEHSHVRQTHPYGFRSGEWARILTTVESYGRQCWFVQFEDGVTDWWPIEDAGAGYEVRP
jgi:deferrochelatase/peroxidase EfeB